MVHVRVHVYSEGNRRDAPSVSFATEPLHGLFCKRRWRRVCDRHINRMPGVQNRWSRLGEPRETNGVATSR